MSLITYHFIATDIEGVRTLYADEMDDTQFYNLLGKRNLPRGFYAYHVRGDEIDNESTLVRALRKMPIVVGLFGNWIKAEEDLRLAWAREDAASKMGG